MARPKVAIVLDLSEMRAIDIDVERRTAWAQTGMTAAGYSTATAAHGLATGFGDTGSVGIGGITLGGGIGYLVRKYGLTIDDLLAAEIVTADGDLLRVDGDTHPDLFWAIRGGGGNFGVATRFRFRLHPVDTVMGGMLVLPATSETITSFIALADAAPEELSTIANVMPAPPMPFLPEERHGELVILAMLVHAGGVADRREGAGALPRDRRADSPTCSGRCRTPRSIRPTKRATIPSPSAGRCSSTASIARWPTRSWSTWGRRTR